MTHFWNWAEANTKAGIVAGIGTTIAYGLWFYGWLPAAIGFFSIAFWAFVAFLIMWGIFRITDICDRGMDKFQRSFANWSLDDTLAYRKDKYDREDARRELDLQYKVRLLHQVNESELAYQRRLQIELKHVHQLNQAPKPKRQRKVRA